MSDTVIRVENISKKYIIGHQQQGGYTALRDVTNERERQTYYGALDYHQKEFLIQAAKKGDSTNTIAFLEYLMQQRPTARLGIIWDGASYHRSQEIKEYLEKKNEGKPEEEWKITCIRFAPNAPEQNPVEDVWLQGKNFLRKLAYRMKQGKRTRTSIIYR